MKIKKQFNQLSYQQIKETVIQRKKYTNFNSLGLYRGILENEKLTLQQKIELRDFAHEFFYKSYLFLQVKDPHTYYKHLVLGEEEVLTVADERQIWQDIRHNQAKILKKKRIKHHSFGIYSKHDCGNEACPYHGVMFKEGSIYL